MTKDKNPNLALRITVESGGCHGFQYLMSLTKVPSYLFAPSSTSSEGEPLAEDDTVFAGPHDTKVVIDESSLELLKGSKVDYTMELIGSQFKVVGIPGATSSCGCGTSFDVKV
jgi:Fe-S cluster assembly iron-binding protein IscA